VLFLTTVRNQVAMALGHPKGLFPLFFIEMWERLAFYTMVGILVLYTTDVERGGLGLPEAEGNAIYGLYLAFVYFTPFLGGLIADRFLGYRRAVFLGGILMATGLFLMGVEGKLPFQGGLVLLVIGNGFFKPNISVMVGNLYVPGDPKRDAGFNIFYMGINIGAFAANYVAAIVRNKAGWLWTFRAAGIGLCVGLVILLIFWKLLERADRRPERSPEDTGFKTILLKILLPAFGVGTLGYFLAQAYIPSSIIKPAYFGFLVGGLPVVAFFVRLGLTAPEEERPGLLALLPIFAAGATFFMILHLNGSAMTQWARDTTDREIAAAPGFLKQEALPQYYLNAGEETPRPDPRSLLVVDSPAVARMYGLQRMDETAVEKVQAAAGDIRVIEVSDEPPEGTDDVAPEVRRRSVRVYENGDVKLEEGTDSHGAPTVSVELDDGVLPKARVAFVRTVDGKDIPTYVVDDATFKEIYEGYEERFGKKPELLPPGQFVRVINSELYQSLNAMFVVAFTPLLVGFFQFLQRRKRGISTAQKVFLGLVLTTLSLLLMAVGGFLSDDGTSKVSGMWLVGFYAIVTLGELCLSPMGLSLVTKLSPKRLVGLTMGGWFVATALGNVFSGFFGGIQHRLTPTTFFLVLAGLAALTSFFIYLLLPRLEAALRKYGA
jgi:dipeptide/tripeptide permease